MKTIIFQGSRGGGRVQYFLGGGGGSNLFQGDPNANF